MAAIDPRGIGSDRRRQIAKLLQQVGLAPASLAPPAIAGAGNVVGTVVFEGERTVLIKRRP